MSMTTPRGKVTGYHGFAHSRPRVIVIDVDCEKDADRNFVCPLENITLNGEPPTSLGSVVDFFDRFITTIATVTNPDFKNTIGDFTPCDSIALTALE